MRNCMRDARLAAHTPAPAVRTTRRSAAATRLGRRAGLGWLPSSGGGTAIGLDFRGGSMTCLVAGRPDGPRRCFQACVLSWERVSIRGGRQGMIAVN